MDNPPVYAISPKFTTLDFPDFPNGMTLENKIDVFEDRIDGWQIGIAKKIIQHEIQHSDYALLQIVFSYFEMIGRYISGSIGDNRPSPNFKKGVKATFPEIGSNEEKFLDTLYVSVRCGLYHTGLPQGKVLLSCEIPGSIRFISEIGMLVICANHLVKDLDIRFHKYITDLRNPKNIELRKNFELRFNKENKHESL